MQQTWRLSKSRESILAIDMLSFSELEKIDREKERLTKMRQVFKELVPERIIVKQTITRLTPFERYVQYVRDNSSSFTCHHRRFYWTPCMGCRRTATDAKAKRAYYRKRICTLLSIEESSLR